jgi:peptidoglycan hydrolase-like protein with peptidoglycan-binding domain
MVCLGKFGVRSHTWCARALASRPQLHEAKESLMKKVLATLMLGLLLAAPMVAAAAGADRPRESLPAAVDQLLARDMIQQAQMHLKLAGLNPGRADGVFDARTADAVRQYQAAHGIPVSGLLDEPTRSVMFPGFQDRDEG